MAMRIMNNPSAMMTLGELNKNITRLGRDLKKVSTGMKIIGAVDDASGYAISEKMRVQIRGLDQDVDNVKNGRSLFNVAAGGIENIVDELRNLKELALNAANDTNTDVDRKTIQKEFDSRKANIDDIATNTNYNGKVLLDGTYCRPRITQLTSPIAYASVFHANVAEPSGATQALTGDNNVISSGGVYDISGCTGTIQVNTTDGVKLTGTATGVTTISGPSGGNANLWIENLNITTTSAGNIIAFQGGNNVLSVKGDNALTSSDGNSKAIIKNGNGLVVQSADGSGTLTIAGNGTGAGIGSDAGGSGGDIGIYGVEVTFNNEDAGGTAGSAIGAGAGGGKVGNIQIEDAVVTSNGGKQNGAYANGQYHAAIGSGSGNSSCGDILIVNSDITTYCTDTGVGSGFSGSTCGNISIGNSTLKLIGNLSACIGAGDASSCGDITIYPGTAITSAASVGASIGSGQNNSKAGAINVYGGVTIDHTSNTGAVIGTGYTGHVGTITLDSSTLANLDASHAWTSEDQIPPFSGIGPGKDGDVSDISSVVITPRPGHPLIIHHGTKANEAMVCYIEDLRCDAMGLNNGVNVLTRDNAVNTIQVVDDALEYALNEATYVGSYITRLGLTESNLVTASENTQSSESVIRDADMAKEMMAYARDNVLAQASQSMLAQANQTASSVLSLLQ